MFVERRGVLRLTWAFSVLPFQTATAPSTCLLNAQTFTSYWRLGAETQTQTTESQTLKGAFNKREDMKDPG